MALTFPLPRLWTGRPGLRRARPWLIGLAVVLTAPLWLTVLYTVVPPVSLPMLGRAVTLQPVDRRWTPLAAMGAALPEAVLSSEDARFCQHWGVDFGALELVLRQGGDAGPQRGASTISMQVAKNLYLWPLPALARKPLEIPLALWIDLVWTKRRVMEVYLNIAQWGDGIYGAEAGARAHFAKPVRALTAREAALLAVSLPNPLERDAADPSRHLRELARVISARARSSGGTLACIH